MSDDESAPTSGDATWREPLLAFGGVLLGLIAVTLVASLWPPLSAHILALAAIIFLAVPYLILRRRGADFRRYGIDFERIPLRHVGLGLLVTAVVFPLFAVGNHLWETQFLERDFHYSTDHYRQWSVDLEAPPLERDDLVQVRTTGQHLRIEWREQARPSATLEFSGDRPFMLRGHAPLRLEPGDPAHQWTARSLSPEQRATILLSNRAPDGERFDLPTELTIDVDAHPDRAPPEVIVGATSHAPDETIELRRTYWWLVLWALTHLLLVALPEEYFYRGYLQTRFSDLLQKDGEPRKFLGFTAANWLTSFLFAIGHLLVPVGGILSPARGAVFFPSLIFGWLRDRTGSVIAPIIFHAAANMMVLIVAVHYF